MADIRVDDTFHEVDCERLDSKREEISLKDAVAAGFKPCTICRPLHVKGNAQYQGSHSEAYEKKEHPRPVVVKSLPPIRPYDNSLPGASFNETNR